MEMVGDQMLDKQIVFFKEEAEVSNIDLGFAITNKNWPLMPSVKVFEDDVPFAIQKVRYGMQYQPRKGTMTIRFVVDSDAELSEKFNELIKILSAETFTFMLLDVPYVFEAHLNGDPREQYAFNNMEFEFLKDITIRMESTTPFKYTKFTSNELITSESYAGAGMGLKAIDNTTIYSLDESVVDIDIDLFNAGTHDAYPQIVINGDFSGLEIGELISVSDLSGEYIIDCLTQDIFKVADPIEDARSLFGGDFITVPPGDTTIKIKKASGTGTITIKYRHTYL